MSQQIYVGRKFTVAPGCELVGLDSISPPGLTYYVNNITGNDSNSGLSWNDAVAQVEQALVLSEAKRVVGGTSTDYYKMNRIVIQGTGTAYTEVTTEPNYCDIVGFGSSIRSNGAGQVQIGHADGSAVLIATTGSRGANWFNIQFTGGGSSKAPFNATGSMLRCEFHGCSFYPTIASSAAGMQLNGGTYAGIVLDGCHFGKNLAITEATYGFYVTGQFSDCLVKECVIGLGSTAAYYSDAYLQDATVVKQNTCIGGTYGIRDASLETTVRGLAFYINNYCFGTTAGLLISTVTTLHSIGNWSNANGTVTRLTSTTD